VLFEQAAGLDVVLRRRAFVHSLEHRRIGRVDSHQHVQNASLAVQRQKIGVPNNVGCADGGEELHGQFPPSHFGQELPPEFLTRRRIFIGQRDEANVVFPVEPFDFIRQFHGIAMPPLHPEAVLAAVRAAVRATA
jgi:hypothetical protein